MRNIDVCDYYYLAKLCEIISSLAKMAIASGHVKSVNIAVTTSRQKYVIRERKDRRKRRLPRPFMPICEKILRDTRRSHRVLSHPCLDIIR